MLDKIVNWVKGLGAKQEGKSSTGQWIAAALVGIVSLVALAYAAYTQWKLGNQLATLQHEKDVTEEKAVASLADTKIETEKVKIGQAQAAYDTHVLVVKQLETQITETQKTAQDLKDKVNAIKNWDEVDKFNNSPPTP